MVATSAVVKNILKMPRSVCGKMEEGSTGSTNVGTDTGCVADFQGLGGTLWLHKHKTSTCKSRCASRTSVARLCSVHVMCVWGGGACGYCVCVCVCVCVLELCRRIRKRLRDGRLMSASLAHGSPSVYICWAYLLPSAKTCL